MSVLGCTFKFFQIRKEILDFVVLSRLLKSSHPEVFFGKGVLKIRSKFTGEHLCRSEISIKSQSNFIKIALWHGGSPVNLLHIFKTPFPKNTTGRTAVSVEI